MKVMKTVRFVVPLLMTTFGFPAYGSAEIYYPWCAVLDTGDAAYNCGFVTIEQCRATVSGIGGSCDPNPWYTPPSRNPSATAAFGQSRQQYRFSHQKIENKNPALCVLKLLPQGTISGATLRV